MSKESINSQHYNGESSDSKESERSVGEPSAPKIESEIKKNVDAHIQTDDFIKHLRNLKLEEKKRGKAPSGSRIDREHNRPQYYKDIKKRERIKKDKKYQNLDPDSRDIMKLQDEFKKIDKGLNRYLYGIKSNRLHGKGRKKDANEDADAENKYPKFSKDNQYPDLSLRRRQMKMQDKIKPDQYFYRPIRRKNINYSRPPKKENFKEVKKPRGQTLGYTDDKVKHLYVESVDSDDEEYDEDGNVQLEVVTGLEDFREEGAEEDNVDGKKSRTGDPGDSAEEKSSYPKEKGDDKLAKYIPSDDIYSNQELNVETNKYRIFMARIYTILAYPRANRFSTFWCIFLLLIILLHTLILSFATVAKNQINQNYMRFAQRAGNILNVIYLLFIAVKIIVSPKKTLTSEIGNLFNLFLASRYMYLGLVLDIAKYPDSLIKLVFYESFRNYHLITFLYLIEHGKELEILIKIVMVTKGTMIVILVSFLVFCLGVGTFIFLIEMQSASVFISIQICIYYVVMILTTLGMGDILPTDKLAIITIVLISLSSLTAVFPSAVIANEITNIDETEEEFKKEFLSETTAEKKLAKMDNSEKQASMRRVLLNTLDHLHQLYFANAGEIDHSMKMKILLQHRLLELRALCDAFKSGNYEEFADIYHKYARDAPLPAPEEIEEEDLLYFGPEPVGSFRYSIWRAYEKPETPLARLLILVSLFMTASALFCNLFTTLNQMVFFRRSQHYCQTSDPIEEWDETLRNIIDDLGNIENLFTVFFACEYFLRVICAPSFIGHISKFYNIVDLFLFLPLCVAFFVSTSVSETEMMKVSRTLIIVAVIKVLRIFKYSKHSAGLITLGSTLQHSSKELLTFILFLFLSVVSLGSIIYIVENKYTSAKSEVQNILRGTYGALNIMSTVGLGTVAFNSMPGQYVVSVFSIFAVFILGLPIGMFQSNFMSIYNFVLFRKNMESKKRLQLFLNFPNFTHLNDKTFVEAFEVSITVMSTLLNSIKHYDDLHSAKAAAQEIDETASLNSFDSEERMIYSVQLPKFKVV